MTSNLSRKTESGFTLVELAIVLMIIGLLIGGILRGQELMENARVTSTIQQTKAYDGAVTTFRDAYASLPGDIIGPATRLANCSNTTYCGHDGDGNGMVGPTIASTSTTIWTGGGSEYNNFWIHLAVTHLISGVNPAATGLPSPAWGTDFPSGKIAGGFHVAQINIPPPSASVPGINGLFLMLQAAANTPNINEAVGASAISPLRAAQIDRKLDDGLPQTGDVIGASTDTSCTGTAYLETSEQKSCDLLIRVQS